MPWKYGYYQNTSQFTTNDSLIHSLIHSFIHSFVHSVRGMTRQNRWCVWDESEKWPHTFRRTQNSGHSNQQRWTCGTDWRESHFAWVGVPLIFRLILMLQSISFHVFFLSPDRFNRSFSTEMSVLIPDSGKFDLHAYEQTAKKRKEHYYLMNSIGYLCQCVFSPRFDIISFLLALYAMTQRYLSTELVQFWRNRSSHTTSIEWMEDKGKTNSTYNTHYGAFLSSSIIHDTHTHRECPFECFRPTPKCINT